MGTLNSWQVVDANNNAAPPDGWPENTMNYSDVNNTGRAVQGTMKRFFADINGSLAAGGAADAYTLTLNESGYSAYFNGMMFSCSIPATNLTTTPTMDVNGIGAATIVDRLGNALSPGELMVGGIYDFRHDGTDIRLIGSGGVAGVDTEFQFNNAGAFGGSPGLTYNTGTDEVTAANPFNLTSDLVFAEQADHASTPAGGFGYLWVRDDTPNILVFTDDQGNDTQLGTVGTTLPGGADTNIQFNNAGVFGGEGALSWNTGATFGDQLVVDVQSGLTSGNVAKFQNTIVNTHTGDVVAIEHSAPAATGDALSIDASHLGRGLFIDNNGSGSVYGATIEVRGTSNSGLEVVNISSTIGNPLSRVYNNQTTFGGPLFAAIQDNTSNAAIPIVAQQDGSGPHIQLEGDNGEGIRFDNPQISTDSRTFDWYEEGSTTAYLDTNSFGDGQSDGQTYGANNNVWYTRIGRIVFIQGRLQVTNIGTLSGSPIFIVFDPQLPWLFGEATNYHFGISDSSSLSKGADHSVNGYFSGLSGAIALEISDGNTGHTLMTAAQFSNNGDIFFTGWYQVNSA